MISNLLEKEIRLAGHPNLFVFSLMGALVLVPGYPYSMVFLFVCIGNFVNLLYARETHDIYYTALLPIKKVDVVTSKFTILIASEIFALLFTVPFAFIRLLYLRTIGNPVGIEANVAFFGIGLLIFSVFNWFFLPLFFQTAYQAGKSFILAIIPATIVAIIGESLAHLLPWLDSVAWADQLRQLPILAVGSLLFILSSYSAKKRASRNFLAVNL